MVERTSPELTWATLHLFLKVNCVRMIRFRPVNMGRAKQRYYRSAKSGRKMTRPAIGGNEQVRPSHTSFGQSDRQGIIGQGVHRGTVSLPDDFLSGLLFGRSA